MLQKLNELHFHDAVLTRLNFELPDKIALSFEQEEKSTTVSFSAVTHLNVGNLTDYEDFEIAGATFTKSDGRLQAHFIFLLGFGKPTWEIRFLFEDCSIDNG